MRNETVHSCLFRTKLCPSFVRLVASRNRIANDAKGAISEQGCHREA